MPEGNLYAREQLRLIEHVISALETWPADLRAFDSQYESFGSWEFIIRRDGQRTRFVFDGRDRYLFAHRIQPQAGDFTVPARRISEMPLPEGLTSESISVVLEFIREATKRQV